jgi:surface polysaccharide O-acyltransferase-like enzyme
VAVLEMREMRSMLVWRLFAAVFAISAAFQFVYLLYFVPGRGNVSAIDLIGFYGQPLVFMIAAIFCTLMNRHDKSGGR